MTGMSRETLHLVDLCAKQRGFSAVRSVEPGSSFDWSRFLDAADRHKVVGLAYRSFAGGHAPLPPPEILARLKRSAAAKAAAKSMLLSDWLKVEEALRAADVRVLMIKGPALSLQLYGDAGSREWRDIDLLVDASALERTADVFASIGYEAQNADFDWSKPKREFLRREDRHLTLKKKGFPTYFEVHGAKSGSIGLAPIAVDEAFERAEFLRSEGMVFPTFGRSDHALLALIHGAHHEWCQLQWVLDAMSLLDDPSVHLVTRAKGTWEDIDPLYALDSFLVLADRLFVAPSLDRFGPATRLRNRRAAGLSRFAYAQFAVGGAGMVGFRHIMGHEATYLPRLRRGLAGKARMLTKLARPNVADLASFRNRDLPLFVYYLARPFLLAVRVARRAAGRQESEPE